MGFSLETGAARTPTEPRNPPPRWAVSIAISRLSTPHGIDRPTWRAVINSPRSRITERHAHGPPPPIKGHTGARSRQPPVNGVRATGQVRISPKNAPSDFGDPTHWRA